MRYCFAEQVHRQQAEVLRRDRGEAQVPALRCHAPAIHVIGPEEATCGVLRDPAVEPFMQRREHPAGLDLLRNEPDLVVGRPRRTIVDVQVGAPVMAGGAGQRGPAQYSEGGLFWRQPGRVQRLAGAVEQRPLPARLAVPDGELALEAAEAGHDLRIKARGARVVARAWSDPAYKERLLGDATAAIADLGYGGSQGENMVVVENTEGVHNLIVCTLCSCYPWSVLGLPPVWYKAPAYRSRAVIDPRGVLEEFGLRLPQETTIRVWDSTAELRYLVVPLRPQGSDGMTEDQLAELVTRDSMIGTGLPLEPAST